MGENFGAPEGRDKIGLWAFEICALLHDIVILPSVKEIEQAALASCSRLMNDQLGEGLEKIGWGAIGCLLSY